MSEQATLQAVDVRIGEFPFPVDEARSDSGAEFQLDHFDRGELAFTVTDTPINASNTRHGEGTHQGSYQAEPDVTGIDDAPQEPSHEPARPALASERGSASIRLLTRLGYGAAVLLATAAAYSSKGVDQDSSAIAKSPPQAKAQDKPIKATQAEFIQRVSVSPQTITNRIHKVIQRRAGDFTQGTNPNKRAKFRGVWYFVNRIVPSSAHLEPSSGGFKTKCDNPYISTYKYFEISPSGERFQTCGPLVHWLGGKTKENEYQNDLNKIGRYVLRKIGRPTPQQASKITSTRLRTRASFVCTEESQGIRTVTLLKNKAKSSKNSTSRAYIKSC